MSAILHVLDQRRLIDSNGIASGASIYFYVTGTTTPAHTYTTADLDVEHPNPIVVGGGAQIPDIYLDSNVTYRRKIVYLDGTVDDIDPYAGADTGLRAELAASTGGSLVAYTATGAGGATRTVASKLGDRINSKDYGTAGDGAADDGAEYGAAIDAGLSSQLPVYSEGATNLLTTWTRKALAQKLTLRGPNATVKGPVASTDFVTAVASFDIEGMTFDRWAGVVNRLTADGSGTVNLGRFVWNHVTNTTGVPVNFEVPVDGLVVAFNKFDAIASGTYAVRVGWNSYANQADWTRSLSLFNLFDGISGNLSATSSIMYGKDHIQVGNRVYNMAGTGLEAHGFYTKCRNGIFGFDRVDGVDSSGGTDITGRTVKGGNRTVDRGAWATATAYAVNDRVTQSGTSWVAVVAHTSGVFLTDKDTSGYWTAATPEGFGNLVIAGTYTNIGSAGVRGTGARTQTTENRFAFCYAEDTGQVGFGMDAPSGNMGQIAFCRTRFSANLSNYGNYMSQGGYGNAILYCDSDGALIGTYLGNNGGTAQNTRLMGGFSNLPAAGVAVQFPAGGTHSGVYIHDHVQRGGSTFVQFNAGGTRTDVRLLDNVIPAGVPFCTGTPPADLNVRHVQKAQTTDATVNNIFAFTLPDNSAFLISARFVGVQTGGGANRAFCHQEGLAYRAGGGAATLSGLTNIIAATKSDATWGVMEIFVAGNDMRVRLQGKAATTINWKVEVNLIAVDGA